MPLSEHEQQVIDELEEALYHDDPQFAHRVSAPHPAMAAARRRLGFGVLGVVSGLVLLLSFCWTTVVAVGALGFLVMLTSLDTLWTTISRMRVSGFEAHTRRPWIACTADEVRDRFRDWVRHHR